jgi:hypothetical protein
VKYCGNCGTLLVAARCPSCQPAQDMNQGKRANLSRDEFNTQQRVYFVDALLHGGSALSTYEDEMRAAIDDIDRGTDVYRAWSKGHKRMRVA